MSRAMNSKTRFITQESPANALALNKDNTRVVIAGRSVFKVYSLANDKFGEIYNLRVGKNLNLDFSCNDITWNRIDDHILATAATNGAVVLWNLNRPTRCKQEHVFSDHKRTVNKVSFHMSEPHLLISGSQDGTMKCFDLRIKQAIKTFHSNTDSVRDVQFSPHQQSTFCAVSENGHVQLWDLRRPDRYFQNYAAHSGPIFACDWHPETSWLATASRDKTIKVWDLSVKATCERTINTIASVGKIKWRPQHKYHIASSSLVLDFSINVWDLRRPYIPFASFNEHKDVPTGFAWLGDPDAFLSISRDCTLYHHAFQDATNPASKANPQGLAVDLKGDITSAVNANTAAKPKSEKPSTSTKKPAPNNASCSASSVLREFTNSDRGRSSFRFFAENYIMSGKFSDICEHNAKVAAQFGYDVHRKVWEILKVMYATPEELLKKVVDETLNLSQMNLGTATEPNVTDHNNDSRPAPADVPSAASGGDDETETDETPENQYYPPNLPSGSGTSHNSYKRPPLGDFIFGEEDEEPMPMEMRPDYVHNLIDDEDDWVLPQEAFELRHDLDDQCPSPGQFPSTSRETKKTGPVINEEPPRLVVADIPKPKAWDPSPTVEQAVRFHVEIRDIQTAVMILIVIGDHRNALKIDIATQEQWVMEYIDQLSRHKLYNVMTQIIQSSWIPSVRELNQQSTTYNVRCSGCHKNLPISGGRCVDCSAKENKLCSICHRVVRGMYVWCRFCAHGGHLEHMQTWFTANRLCPTGCGHACEFTN